MSTLPKPDLGGPSYVSTVERNTNVTRVELQRYFDRESAELRVRQVQAQIFVGKLENPKFKQDVNNYVKELQRLHAWIDEFSKRFTSTSERDPK